MPKTVIPSLTLNNPLIRDKATKIAYLIRHAMNAPGWTSSMIEEQLISARKCDAIYGPDPQKIANALEQQLSEAISYHYDNIGVKIKVEAISEGSTKYKMIITVTDNSTGTVMFNNRMVKSENGEFVIVAQEVPEV